MPAERNKTLARRRNVLAAAVVAAIALPTAAVDIKPGDIIFGTSQNNPAGAGRLYVYDPIVGTITRIGGDFGNGVGGLALDNNYNLIVGTTTVNTGTSGRLFSVNPTTGATSQIGSQQFFNGVGGLAYDAQSGDIYVGTKANSTSGQGQVYRLDSTNGFASSQFGTDSFANGVTAVYFRPDPSGSNPTMYVGTGSSGTTGRGKLYSVDVAGESFTAIDDPDPLYANGFFNSIEDIAADRDGNNIVFGTGSNQSVGIGNLFNFDGSAATKVDGDYFNRVSSVAYDFDGQLYFGTNSNGSATAGHLYSVDKTTGDINQVVPSNFSPDIFNGVTAMIAVQPLPDFVGGNNVVIDGSGTSLSMFNQTSPVDGSINWFSGTTSQNIDIADVYGTLGQSDAGVRTGSGLPNNEQGDLTLSVDLDFDAATTGTSDVRILTLRAADDLIIDGEIKDFTGGDDSLNLNLYARNQRRVVLDNPATLDVDESTGIDLAAGDDVAGKLDINAPIHLGAGNLYAYGNAFDNTETGATVTTAGNVELEFTGDVTISSPLFVDGDVMIAAGQFSNIAAGTITDVAGTGPVNSFTLVATAANVEGVDYDGSITIDGDILANTFSFTGVDFTNSVPLDAVAGTFTINNTGVVTINNDLHSAGAMQINGSSFDNPAGIVESDDSLTLNITGPIVVTSAMTGASITTTGTDLTINNTFTSTVGGITLDHTGTIDINDAVTSAGDMLINQLEAAPGAVSVDAAVNVTSGVLTSRGTTFDTTADITVGGAITLEQTDATTIGAQLISLGDVMINQTVATPGAIAINGEITVGAGGNLGARGTTFDSSANVNVTGDVNLAFDGQVNIGGAIADETNKASSITISAGGLDTTNGPLTTSGLLDIDILNAGSAEIDAAIIAGSVDMNVADQLTTTSSGTLTVDGLTNLVFADATLGGNIVTGQLTTSGNALTIDGTVETTAGDMTLEQTGAIDINNTTTIAGDLLVNQVLGQLNTISIDGNTTAVNLRTKGTDFSNSGTLSLSGELELDQVGAVSINAEIATPTGILINASDFENTATITGTSDSHAEINLTGKADIDADITVGSLDIDTTATGIDGTLSTTAKITATNAGVRIDHPASDITIAGGIETQTSIDINPTGGTSNVLLDSAILINGAGDLTVYGTNFESTAAGTIDGVNSSVTLNQSGTTVIAGDVTIGNDLTTNGDQSFQNSGIISVGQDITLNHAGQTITVDGDVSAGRDITLNQPGDVTFNAAVSADNDVTMNQPAAVLVNAPLTVGNNLTIDGTSTLSTTATGTVDVTGTTLITVPGHVQFDGAMQIGPMTINAPSLTTTATIDGDGAIDLNIDDAIDIGANVTTTGASSDLTADSVTFDSTGAVLDIGGLIKLNQSSDITTDAMTAGASIEIDGTSFTVTNGQLITTLGGNLTIDAINGTNTVQLGGGASVVGNLTSTGSTFDSTGGDSDGATSGIVTTGLVDLFHTGAVTTSGIDAGSTVTIHAPSISIDGAVVADGTTTLTATEGNIDSTLGVDVTVGDLLVAANTQANQNLNTVGGDVTVAGLIDINISGDMTTNSVAAIAGPITIVTGSDKTIHVDGDLSSGDAITSTTNGITVTGNTVAGAAMTINSGDAAVEFVGTTTTGDTLQINAGQSPITFNGDLTINNAGHLDINGGNTVTSNSAAVIAQSTDINTTGDVNLNTLQTGTTLDVVTDTGSSFTSNSLTTLNGTTNITAPAGITLNGTVTSAGSTVLTAADGLVDVNANVNVTTGSLTVNSIDFDNADNGTTTVDRNITFNNSGSIHIAQDVTSTGSGTEISFSQSPTLTQDGGATINVTQGLMNFSGGVNASILDESRINSQTGYIGAGTRGDVVLDGGEDETKAEVIWTNTGNLYVGGNATNGNGDATLLVHQNACLIVGGTLKVWAGDTVTLLDGKIRMGNLDLDNQRGNFIWYSGTINDTDNLTVSPLQQIAPVIRVGEGATQTLRLLPDRHLEVNGNTNLQTTLYLDGGVLSTGTLQSGSKLNFITGTLNITNDDFYVVPSQKPAGWTQNGTLGNKTVTLATGQTINVTGAGKTTTIVPNGRLQLDGGEFNAVNGMENYGTIALQDGAGRIYGSGVVNKPGATIYGTGQLDANLTNEGEVRSSYYEVLKLNGASNTSSGVVRMVNGGTIDAPNGLTSSGQIVGEGSIITGKWSTFSDQGVTGSGLSSTGTITFSGDSRIDGDVRISGGGASPRLTTSGGTVASFLGDVIVYDGSILESGKDSRNVYYGLLKGDYVLAGAGDHVIEGTESPGFSPGYGLAMGSRTYADGSTVVFSIGGTDRMELGLVAFSLGGRDNRYTAVDTIGTLSINPNVTFDVQLFDSSLAAGDLYTPTLGDSFELMRAGEIAWVNGASTDSITWSLPSLSKNLTWDVGWSATGVTASVVAVPEPATLSVIALAATGLLRRRRRGA